MRYFIDIGLEEIKQAALNTHSYDEFKNQLGISQRVANDLIAYFLNKENIDFHFNCSKKPLDIDVSNEDFVKIQNIVRSSYSFTEVGQKLGYPNGSKVPNLLNNLGIDYSHFIYLPGNVVVLPSSYEKLCLGSRIASVTLVKIFAKMDIQFCQICRRDAWRANPMPLEIHHRNGNHNDNRIENLLLVCATCHAQIEEQGTRIDVRSSENKRLIEENRYECDICHNSCWNERNIPLEIHHRNGNHYDNQKENLQVVCPNCHTLANSCNQVMKQSVLSDAEYLPILSTSNSFREAMITANKAVSGAAYKRLRKIAIEHNLIHLLKVCEETITDIVKEIQSATSIDELEQIMSARNISQKSMESLINGTHRLSPSGLEYPLIDCQEIRRSGEKHEQHATGFTTCCVCGVKIDTNATYCSKCYNEIQRRVERTAREKLKFMIRNRSFCSIGHQYGVSDNAIRKWCKYYNLPFKTKDIAKYTDEEWDML